jgi:asparaginyl-tRNA synthetase
LHATARRAPPPAAHKTRFALPNRAQIIPSLGREQPIEMQASEIRVLGQCDANKYPLAGKNLSLEFLRENAHLRARTMTMGAVWRVRSALAMATHLFYQGRGFQYVHTPIITASDCEGAGEMFQVTTLIKDGRLRATLKDGSADYAQDFFKRASYLTVSGQVRWHATRHRPRGS